MTLHSLVLISDSFSCNCNSIQSPVSIVHLRVNLILSYPLLRLYINYSISNANHFQLAQQCIQISTRINSSSVHTYIFVCFTLRVILQGFVTQNATTPRSRHPPWDQTPQSRHPQEQTPPSADNPLEPDTPQNRQPPGTRHPPEQTTPWDQSPPRKQTPANGLRAAGTHPTGMHSCF